MGVRRVRAPLPAGAGRACPGAAAFGAKPPPWRYFRLSAREGAVSGAELPSRGRARRRSVALPENCWFRTRAAPSPVGARRRRARRREMGFLAAPSRLASPRHASSRRRTSACERVGLWRARAGVSGGCGGGKVAGAVVAAQRRTSVARVGVKLQNSEG